MNILRNFVDKWYDKNRDRIFAETEDNPEVAHEWFIKTARRIHAFRLERLLLNCRENRFNPGFEISNAAGFNKNGNIPPTFLKYSGLDRVVVGTVTADPWKGNPKTEEAPARIRRYAGTYSMVNWLGLPGVGADAVAKTMKGYGNHGVPITINLMATPGKTGQALLDDIMHTTMVTSDLPYVDRFELNISCPNTHSVTGGDTRDEYQSQLKGMLGAIERSMSNRQVIYLKVSPDLNADGVKDIIEVCRDFPPVRGFTATNTTTQHNPRYILFKPNPEGKGGASGDAVYRPSFDMQETFLDLISEGKYDFRIIAVGGIKSAERARERTYDSLVSGIQVYTPLIFIGPKLIRELRAA